MAYILGIETGTDICSVSLSQDGKLLSLRENEGRDHAGRLAVFIDELLRGNQMEAEELDAVALSTGPGSYTGLRIGASTAKGLCYALEIPLIAVGSLDSMVYVAREDYQAGILDIEDWQRTLLCPMIDARRMEVYMQVFDSSVRPLSEVMAHVITPESLSEYLSADSGRELVLFGNGAAKCKGTLPETDRLKFVEVTPSARGLVEPAYAAFCEGRFEDVAYFEPMYLKDFVVVPSKKKVL